MRALLLVTCFITDISCRAARPRLDSEGHVLFEILSRIGSSTGALRWKSISTVARKHLYPPEVMVSFFDVFMSDPREPVELKVALDQLTKQAVIHAVTDPFSLSILSFLISIGEASEHTSEVERIVQKFVAEAGTDHPTIVSLLQSVADKQGSTLGLLSSVNDHFRSDSATNEMCGYYGDLLGAMAEEAASVDVMNELLAPSLIDSDSGEVPLFRLTAEAIEADAERLGYLVSMMKENAEYFRSSLFMSPMDVLQMMGIDDGTFSEEEIINSADGISAASEHEIALEIVDTIRNALYNVHAMRYNDGAMDLMNPGSCLRGVSLFRKIISSQNLFVKVLMFFLKHNIFVHRDPDRALLTSLFMSHAGVLAGTLNAKTLILKRLKMDNTEITQIKRRSSILVPRKGLMCSENQNHISISSAEDCLHSCRKSPECNFVIFNPTTAECRHQDICSPGESTGGASELYQKIDLSSNSECWPPGSVSEECLWFLNRAAAASHNHTDSINWLVRRYMESSQFDEALEWAQLSAALGSHEGKYYLGTLERSSWKGHKPDKERALSVFWDLLLKTEQEHEHPSHDSDLSDLDQIEQESIRDIAYQLGIPFDDLDDDTDSYQEDPPARIAAIVGIVLTYFELSPYEWAAFITALASIPVLYFVLRGRINLVP